MTGSWSLPFERAQEDLRAAQALLDAGFSSQAVSRAYFAALHTAEAALVMLDNRQPNQVGTIAAFDRHLVQNGFDREVGRNLRKLFEDRNDVDFALAIATDEEGRRAVDEARDFIRVTRSWIDEKAAS